SLPHPPCSTCFVKLRGSELAKDSRVRPEKNFPSLSFKGPRTYFYSLSPSKFNLRAAHAPSLHHSHPLSLSLFSLLPVFSSRTTVLK
ncbi:uncharacterized protein BO72DRAFT_533166, partial [Aspergillus fijiensis CBS 313.89]